MKKQYVKPELIVENFELSTHIASCDFVYTNPADGQCTAAGNGNSMYPGYVLFSTGMDCTITPDNIEDYCEVASAEGVTTWRS